MHWFTIGKDYYAGLGDNPPEAKFLVRTLGRIAT